MNTNETLSYETVTTTTADGKKLLVVWLGAVAPEDRWMERVAEDAPEHRACFVSVETVPSGSPGTRVRTIPAGNEAQWTATALHALAQVGLGPSPSAPAGSGAPQERSSAFSVVGLQKWIERSSRPAVAALVEQLRSPMGVIPFVGAGLSAPFKVPQWGEFLVQTGEQCSVARASQVKDAVEEGRYEEAAELLYSEDANWFQQVVQQAFNLPLAQAKFDSGALAALPHLAPGPVITTNFDRVLEAAFRYANRPFVEVILGNQVDSITRAVHRNVRALIKIHGDCMDRASRTFTSWEYDQSYGTPSRSPSLSSVSWLLFTNRPLLFLGCSLEKDRTVQVLRDIHARLGAVQHFAVLSGSYVRTKLEERQQNLRACGVTPLWYAPKDFGRIGVLLSDARKQTFSTYLGRSPGLVKSSAPAPAPASNFPKAFAGYRRAPVPGAHQPVLDQLVNRLFQGRLIFFLGAYAHLGQFPLGNQFYQNLAQRFGYKTTGWDRAAIATLIRDKHGTDTLVREMRQVLANTQVTPSPIYRLIAGLPAHLRAVNHPLAASSLIVLTTNYDTIPERAFNDAAEPFHLLQYVDTGSGGGQFAHRLPDGEVRMVESPENYDPLDCPAPLLVKLNGGIPIDPAIPESLLVGRGDFERLGGRLSDVLPQTLRRAIADGSLLFFGHGLGEPDVEAVVRLNAGKSPVIKSFAVQIPGCPPEWIDYWAQCGLKIVEADLTEFAHWFHDAIMQHHMGTSAAP
jgi:hypothetical protein